MADEPFGFRAEGDAQRIGVDAIGEPGNRRFRLLAIIDGQTQIVWMEKQQIQALGMALEQVLEQLPEGAMLDAAPNVPLEFDTETTFQFRAGRMELGFDEHHDRLVIIAHDIDSENDVPRLTCRISMEQARSFAQDAATVVSAGRPLCPLCGQPMGPGPHACPQQNGHLPVTDETDEEPKEDAG
jgi:uncharacterized repeat protein (TIGR03847 family)